MPFVNGPGRAAQGWQCTGGLGTRDRARRRRFRRPNAPCLAGPHRCDNGRGEPGPAHAGGAARGQVSAAAGARSAPRDRASSMAARGPEPAPRCLRAGLQLVCASLFKDRQPLAGPSKQPAGCRAWCLVRFPDARSRHFHCYFRSRGTKRCCTPRRAWGRAAATVSAGPSTAPVRSSPLAAGGFDRLRRTHVWAVTRPF